jgi:hypothetical protein
MFFRSSCRVRNVEAEGTGVPAYFITGTESDPASAGFDFKTNCWYHGFDSIIKQASDFPDIAFGTANLSFHTSRASVFCKLIGGKTDSDFHFLPARGVYASAHMDVTVTGR